MADTQSTSSSSPVSDDGGMLSRNAISPTRLLKHSKEAMVAAIEIYNKPSITYRNECTVILVVNSWELALKALLVSNNQSICRDADDHRFSRKTINWRKAWFKSRQFLPPSLAGHATQRNLETLARYRDEAIHFYSSQDMGISLYLLLQAAIANYRDLISHAWSIDIADEMTWHLRPLGMKPPADIQSFFAKTKMTSTGSATSTFLADIHNDLRRLASCGEDIDRFLIGVSIKLTSIKQADSTDAVVGIDGKSGSDDPSVVVHRQDPNQTHPFRQKEILAKIKHIGDRKMTSHVFQAITWKYQLKIDSKYCWIAKEGVLTKYSSEVVKLMTTLTDRAVDEAVVGYRNHLRNRRQHQG